ncbi:sulfotransferase 1C2-like [Patiria miniata]|uniref:Sulfotransferase domain-containing protein n=1 Tax=Patiria miniata TaxID=46514 RepID=A0A914AR80_PATMI|nr:sulfotransferase 1C2-like [Patiria miniata]
MEKYVTLEEFREVLSRRFSDEFPQVLSEYEGVPLFPEVDEVVRELKTFDVREDDCWVVTYPKAGTTWVQEIVSCVMHDGNLQAVNERHTVFRVPYIDQTIPARARQWKNMPPIPKIVAEMPSPRVIKSHLPGQLLPPQLWQKHSKLVYVIRDPKDVIVSFFHFEKMFDPEKAEKSFADLYERAMTGKVMYGAWWDHYLYFWKRRHEPNVLLLRFEDLKKDLRGNIERVSLFLGKNLSAAILDAITEHCTFSNMQKNPMTNMDTLYPHSIKTGGTFMRKGNVGGWKDWFTVAQNEAMDALIKDKLHGTGLTFD